MVETKEPVYIVVCYFHYSVKTYHSCHFDKSSHMTSVAYDRILGQFDVIDFLQFRNEFIVESVQLVP